MPRFRAKTSIATGFGTFAEGDEFNASENEMAGMLRAGYAERVAPEVREPETAVAPIPKQAERAVRFGRR